MKKSILFDLDGTLTDPFTGITKSIVYALEKMGAAVPDINTLGWCIGPPLRDSFLKLLGTDKADAEQAVAFYRERFEKTGMYENRVYEGIPGVLDALQEKGHALYVATSKPWVFAQKIIRHYDLESYFRQIYGAELDGTRGDKPSLIAYILAQECLDPSGTVMVGDTAYDMIGARENGVYGAGVLWGYGSKQDLESSGAGICMDRPRELICL